MNIKILGTGCKKCNELEKKIKETVSKHNIKADVEKVEDIQTIIGYGVMKTPAVVIDGKVVASGRLLSESEILELCQ